MPDQAPKLEDIRGWQLHEVTRFIYKDLKERIEELKGLRPFTPGNPNRTQEDIIRIEAIQATLEELLPLFVESAEEVQEQLSERE